MNFRHMEIFLTVVEEQSLAQAAQRLFITQPAITQVLRKLEDEFGGPLFTYKGKSRELTSLGKACVSSFQNILNQYKRLKNEASDISLNTYGSLSIYAPLRRAQKIFPQVLPGFKSKYPNIDISVIEGRTRIDYMFKQLVDGKVDLSITLHRTVDSRIVFIPFCTEIMSFVASLENPLIQKLLAEGRTSVTIEDILDEKLILCDAVYQNRKLVNKMFASYNRYPDCLLGVQTVELCKSFAAANYGSTIIPELLKKKEVEIYPDARYAVFPIQHPLAQRNISIGYIGERGLTGYQQDFINRLIDLGYYAE